MESLARILLVEDDPRDVELTMTALADYNLSNEVVVAHDGEEALDYLYCRGKFQGRTGWDPAVMLLDLKLPWMDGFDVLTWLRRQRQFDTLPVVVLTSSRLQSDIDRSREMGVYDYRVKPHDFEDLVRLLDDVGKCWLDERFNRYCLLHGAQPEAPPSKISSG